MTTTLYLIDYSANVNGGAERLTHKLANKLKVFTSLDVHVCNSINDIRAVDGTSHTSVIFTASWLRKSFTDAIKVRKMYRTIKIFLISNVSALTPFSYLYDDMKNHFVYDIEKCREGKVFDGIICLNPTDETLWRQMGFPATSDLKTFIDECSTPLFPTKLVLCYMSYSNAKCIDKNTEKAHEFAKWLKKEYGVDVPIKTYKGKVRKPESMFDRGTILFHESLTEGRAQAIIECEQCGGFVVGGYPEERINTYKDNFNLLKTFNFRFLENDKGRRPILDMFADYIQITSKCKSDEVSIWWKTLVNMVISSDASWDKMGMTPPKKKHEK